MTLPQNYIGVDVAKNWIDIYHPDTNQHQQVKTTPQHLHVFAKTCKNALVVFEASGGYERPLMNALEKFGASYVRVNPRQAREFARATGQLAKTDQVDAKMLAHMGHALALQPDAPTDHARLRLSALTARRDALVEHKKQEQNRLAQTTDAFVKSDITSFITGIKRRIKKLEVERATHIKAHKRLARLDRQLRSAPGIGPVTSASLIARLPELGLANRRAIAKLAGLAPQACDSGKMKGKRRIWGGRAEVRRALYMAAFIASRHDPALKAYRQRLESAGKPFKVTIIAVARKLLIQLNAIVREGRNYEQKHNC